MDHGLPMETQMKATRDEYYSVYFERILQVCGGMNVVKKELANDPRFLGRDARRELFLWAIFHDRFNLAKYLCSKTWVRFPFSREGISFQIIFQESNCSSIDWCRNVSTRSPDGHPF